MPDLLTSQFGTLLRRYRLAAGLSQAELAERAGLSPDGIGALETGRRANPRPYTVRALADALSLDEDDRLRLIVAAQAAAPSSTEPPTGEERTADGEWGRLLYPPRPPTRLIGREREVAGIAFAMRSEQVRLITLTGPGGVGKTRLAIAAADAITEAFPDGVAWVELAHIAAPPEAAASRVAAAISRALGVREAVREPVAAPVAESIGSREVALILDNVEHLLAAAPLVADLLAACPRLSVLATSRERLGLRGEREFAVMPLQAPTPAESRQGLADGLAGVAAVRLFVERATEVRGDFSLTEVNAAAVAELCRRLDGLPLAIELAVGWLKILPPEALAAQLAPRLPLLTGGAADLPNRQRTMRDTIAWSHGLLSPDEQRLFRRLGVFAGGFTLEAVEAISYQLSAISQDDSSSVFRLPSSIPSPITLALVAALVDKSLVRPMAPATAAETAPRFGMLETIREFALEQLEASGEAEATRAAHAAYIVELVETLVPTLGGGAQEAGWLERLAAEVPNLRVVLARAVERGEAAVAVRLAEAWQLLSWSSRADSAEALRWLEAALALGSDDTAARVHALIAAASLVGLRGDFSRATILADEGLAVSEGSDYPFGVAYSLFYGGVVAKWRGDLAAAAASLEEAIDRWRGLDEPYWIALAQNNLADIAFERDDIEGAGALAAEGLAGSRAVGDAYGTGLGLGTLAAVACARGELTQAVALLAEGLAVWSSLGDQRGVAGTLAGLAGVSAARGDYARAAHLLGAAAALGEAVGVALLVHNEQYERVLAATRAALGEATFDAACVAGRALSTEGIAELVAEIVPAPD